MDSQIKAPSYNIFIGENSFAHLNNRLAELREQGSRFFIFVDSNTYKHCLADIVIGCEELEGAELLEIEAGEESKDIEIVSQLWQALIESDADRNTVLINLGGGVITDMGGFIASTFKRGITYINVPTSLLAMIDASIGGKTAINMGHYKNQVGLFSNPDSVYINPDFLKSLKKREFMAGYAEALKHALIADADYWKNLCKKDFVKKKHNDELIKRSVEIKNVICTADPLEKDIRKALNFGHTIGHAIESYMMESKPLLHGEAIALGIVAEAYLSTKLSGLSNEEYLEIRKVIADLFKHVNINLLDAETLIALMQKDKKNEDGNINFSLISQIGKYDINKNADIDTIKDVIKHLNEFIEEQQKI